MTKDVLITLKSVQWVDNDKAETELITTGTYEAIDDNGYKISYDESSATGFEGSKTILTCFGNRLTTLNRTGKNSSNLIIEKDKKHHCFYGTPFGEFMMGIYTIDINNNLTDNGGDIYLKYTIDINSSYVSDNEIFLNIK